MTKKAKRKTVTVKPNDYQPSKAELEKDIRIPTTPDRLAKAVTRSVNLRFEK